MKRDDVFPSKYLKAADLNGKPHVVRIARVSLEEMKSPEGKTQEKVVLAFSGAAKTLPVNMVNFDAIADFCGGDTDEWPGKQVELFATTTQMGGKVVPCIRVRQPSRPAQATLPAIPPDDDGFSDTVPF